jgi:hypothetical protein
MLKYRVKLMSSERGWGQEYWHEDFNSFEEASARIWAVNSQNTSARAPDYYEVAEKEITVIKETA